MSTPNPPPDIPKLPGPESEINVRDLMRAMPIETAKKLEGRVDKNHDGHITAGELGQLFHELEEDEAKIKVLRWELLVAVVFLGISIVANLGTAMYAVEAGKETKTSGDGAMKVAGSDTAVSTVDPVMGASTNAQTAGATAATTSSRSRRATTETESVLTDKTTGNPLKTVQAYEARKATTMTSELPDAFFDELEQLSIANANGHVSFDVHGYARYTLEDSRCGSVVVLYTGPGQVQFDGVSMSFSENVAGAFSRAGFHVGNRRRGRRSEDADAYKLTTTAEVLGKFRFLADSGVDLSQLSCGDDRPNMMPPTGLNEDLDEVSYTETLMVKCGSAGKPKCPADSELIQEFEGEKYFTREMATVAKKQSDGTYWQITTMVLPEHRGIQLVAATDGAQTLTYSLNLNTGEQARCSVVDGVAGASMDMNQQKQDNTTDIDLDGFDADSPEMIEFAKYSAGQNATGEVKSESRDAKPPILDFVGYTVLNNQYVRHFSVAKEDEDGKTSIIDYYEHFDEKRMFSLVLNPERAIVTYDTFATNFSAAPALATDSRYPSLDAATADDFLMEPVTCVNHNETNPDQGYVDLGVYQMRPFVQAEWDEWYAKLIANQAANPDAIINQAERRSRKDIDHSDTAEGSTAIPEADLYELDIITEQEGDNVHIYSERRQPARVGRRSLRSQRHTRNAGGRLRRANKGKFTRGGYGCWGREWSHSIPILGGKCSLNFAAFAGTCSNFLQFKFECSVVVKSGGPKVTLGGYIQIEGGVYRDSIYHGWELDLQLMGCAWIQVEDNILGVSCYGKATVCLAYNFNGDKLTLSGELEVRCGCLQANLGASVTWCQSVKGQQFPKFICGFSVSIQGCLVVKTRICIPHVRCGWRGCRSWWHCYDIEVKTCVGHFTVSIEYG